VRISSPAQQPPAYLASSSIIIPWSSKKELNQFRNDSIPFQIQSILEEFWNVYDDRAERERGKKEKKLICDLWEGERVGSWNQSGGNPARWGRKWEKNAPRNGWNLIEKGKCGHMPLAPWWKEMKESLCLKSFQLITFSAPYFPRHAKTPDAAGLCIRLHSVSNFRHP